MVNKIQSSSTSIFPYLTILKMMTLFLDITLGSEKGSFFHPKFLPFNNLNYQSINRKQYQQTSEQWK